MRIAIGLYGSYSTIYKKNNYTCDIFACSFDTVTDSFTSSTILSECVEVSIALQPSRLVIESIDKCRALISEHENKTGQLYDIIIYANFRDLLINIPQEKGVYMTNYFSIHRYYDPYPFVPSIEIVSDTFARFYDEQGNRGDGKLYDHGIERRQLIFDKLFPGRVFCSSKFPAINCDVAVCIPSVIKTSDKPFDYCNHRSIFSHSERLQQTIEQVKSLSERGITPFLLEGSNLSLNELDQLAQYSHIILFNDDNDANTYANISSNKGIYEVYVMNIMLSKITFNWIIKFGGRYKLCPAFDITNLTKDKPVFKILTGDKTYSGKPIVECVMYSIPKAYSSEYANMCNKVKLALYDNSDVIENLIYEYSNDRYTSDKLNIVGRDAINGIDKLL